MRLPNRQVNVIISQPPISYRAYLLFCYLKNKFIPKDKSEFILTKKKIGFGLFPFRSPLLRESLLFSLPPFTKMFQFNGLSRTLLKEVMCSIGSQYWVSPFGNPRFIDCLPSRRGLSQAATSFIVFWYRGIHHMLKSVFILRLIQIL